MYSDLNNCDVPEKPDKDDICGSVGVLAHTSRNHFLIWQDGRLINKQNYDRALEITVECEGDMQYLSTSHGYIGYTGTWRKRFQVAKEPGWRKPYQFRKVAEKDHYNSYIIK